METLNYFFETRALETGIFIVVLSKIIIFIELFTTYKSKSKSDKFVSVKSFLKNYLFLISMLVYGFFLIFKNI